MRKKYYDNRIEREIRKTAKEETHLNRRWEREILEKREKDPTSGHNVM